MNNEINIVFELLRIALNGNGKQEFANSKLLNLNSKEWWRLFRLAQQNHVTALLANALPANTAREVKIPWLAECDKAIHWHHYQEEVQQDIVKTMAKHGIETMVLKGTHTARHYPNPELREFGDLDLYFFDCHDEADRVASETLKVVVNNGAHHHSKYNYRGLTVESHYDFVNTHYPPSNRRYETLLKELVKDSERTQEYPPTFEVLFLLRHMAGHFAAGRITLRDLVDWGLTCCSLRERTDWDLVRHTIEQYGMSRFVATIDVIVHKHLGMDPLVLSVLPLETERVERDIVYGSMEDHIDDGFGRIIWKLRRWNALKWKRKMVYNDNPFLLWMASLTSHIAKPYSIMHKI